MTLLRRRVLLPLAGVAALAAVTALVAVTALGATGTAAVAGPGGSRAVPAAAVGAARSPLAFGVQLDWAAETPASFTARTGIAPAQYGAFAVFPLTAAARAQLATQVAEAAQARAALFLTLEPTGGLATVTPAAARELALLIAGHHAAGVEVLVRFAHEMNGSWYAWGQQPAAYVSAFRTVAAAVHELAPGNPMVWSPSYGGGSPFAGGTSSARPGTPDFAALDTDGDGTLTMSDDPYAPYWPGDDAVDRVGLTVYHWGEHYPWGEDEVPAPGTFVAEVTGTRAVDGEAALPDFHAEFSEGHRRPMAISETAALYSETPPAPGATQVAIGSAWVAQVLDPGLATRLPRLDMVNWFEQRKAESATGTVVDWRVTADPQLLAALRTALAARQRA